MQSLILPVHSFVDVITNSSSEVFVTSDRKTVETIKAVVNAILAAGGSSSKCDDLFVITLGTQDGGYGEYHVVEVHAKTKEAAKAAEILNTLNDMFTAETIGND